MILAFPGFENWSEIHEEDVIGFDDSIRRVLSIRLQCVWTASNDALMPVGAHIVSGGKSEYVNLFGVRYMMYVIEEGFLLRFSKMNPSYSGGTDRF